MSGIDLATIVKDKVAFDGVTRGYRFVGTYLVSPKGEALIEIFKGEELVKRFLWPDYKVWNIAAHAEDIVDGLEAGNSDGLYVAGSTGFGGNVFHE
jgi:hypothetical protein